MTGKQDSRLRDPVPIGGQLPPETPLAPDVGSRRNGVPQRTDRAAQVQPLDVTGVRTVAVGACLWLATFLVLLPFYGTLRDQGRGWWLWTCVAGFALGLVGLEYCRRRRARLAGQPHREVETSPLGAAGF